MDDAAKLDAEIAKLTKDARRLWYELCRPPEHFARCFLMACRVSVWFRRYAWRPRWRVITNRLRGSRTLVVEAFYLAFLFSLPRRKG